MNPWDTYYTSNQPLFHVGRVPFYVTTLVIALQVLAMVALALIGYGSPLIGDFIFSSANVEAGKLWTLVTYAFVQGIDFWAVLSLVFFYLFGIRVEMHLGTRRYMTLIGVLLIGPTLFLTLYGLIFGDLFASAAQPGLLGRSVNGYATSDNLRLSVLIAFVWLHSDALFWPGIKAKWLGIIFVSLQTLQFLALRMWVDFYMCWLSLLLAYVVLRRMGMGMRFPAVEEPLLSLLASRKSKGYRSSRRKLKVVKPPRGSKKNRYESKLRPKVEENRSTTASVDHLLEKIAREGLSSLTPEERKELENASNQLTDKD